MVERVAADEQHGYPGYRGLTLHLREQIETAHVGESDVEDDDVGPRVSRCRRASLPDAAVTGLRPCVRRNIAYPSRVSW